MKWIFVLRKQIGSTTFLQNVKKIDAKEPIFFFTFYLKLFLEISNFSEICSKIFKFQDIFWILKKFRKMTFYQFVESKGEMVFGFGKTHYFNHIFPKFCKNCRRATNFFGSLFESSCSVLCVFFAYFFEKNKDLSSFWAKTKNLLFFIKEKNFVLQQQHFNFSTACIYSLHSWIQNRYSNRVAFDLPNENKKENNFLVLKVSTSVRINGVSTKIDFWPISRIIRWNGFLFWETQIGSTTFLQNLKKIDAKEPFFFSLFSLNFFWKYQIFLKSAQKYSNFRIFFGFWKNFAKWHFTNL